MKVLNMLTLNVQLKKDSKLFQNDYFILFIPLSGSVTGYIESFSIDYFRAVYQHFCSEWKA